MRVLPQHCTAKEIMNILEKRGYARVEGVNALVSSCTEKISLIEESIKSGEYGKAKSLSDDVLQSLQKYKDRH